MTFLWSDAWIMQAIAIASAARPADLVAILEAAAASGEALPTPAELRGALRRLVDGGFVDDAVGRFRPSSRVTAKVSSAARGADPKRGREAAAKLLGAEVSAPAGGKQPPRKELDYPGLTDRVLERVVAEYRRKAKASPGGSDR